MNTTTNNGGNSKTAIPQVTTFQFSNEAIGKVKDSVNLFTGTANLPLNIASLPGRKDLDVNVGIMYSSNIQNNVKNWNLTNPTGILGLGWDMELEKIIVNKNGSGTTSSDEYYILSNGTGNKLVQDGIVPSKPINIQTFQTRNFEFWDIKYDPSKEKWTVIKEDGTVYIYGDNTSDRNTLQFGVGWGNWLGDSVLASGQEQYVTSWNLSEIQNAWGEKVVYTYDNVQVKTGTASGLEYTQASYLKTITDSFNRTITFNYDEKFGAKNPGTKNIIEYQAANAQQPSPNAYQEQYETRYLDSIDVHNANGKLQFTILFEYDFINLGVTSQPAVYPLMWKRVLTSFWQVQPTGKSLPGMEFEYYKDYNDVNPGALKDVVYPQGAKASYTYKQQPLNTARNINLTNPLQGGGIPRVWYGTNYTVVTWYNATAKTLKAMVYSWCGNWITYELNSKESAGNYFNNVDFDIASLGVIAKDDYIALYFTEKTKKQLQLFLYRRNPENFGIFNLTNGPQFLPVQSATANVGVQAGNDFVLVYGKGLTNNPITAFQWNWKQRVWNITPGAGTGNITVMTPSPADIAKASNFVITAFGNYYIAALYTPISKLLQFQLFYHDGNNTWSKSTLYNTSNVTIYHDINNPTEFPFNLSLSNSFAVATYITSVSPTDVSYSLRTLQWDKSFNLLNAGTPLVNNYKSPVSNNKPQFSVFSTILSNAQITNNPNLQRYIGGPATSNNPLNWKQAQFATQPTDTVAFAAGQDISLLSKTQGTSATNQYLQFNANTDTWSTPQNLGSTGTNPTIYGNFLTAGKDVFYKNPQGQWIKQQQGLNNLTAPQTVQNRGASYIAYQDTTGNDAQTYFAAPQNGILGAPQQLNSNQKIYVDQDTVKPGTILAGSNTFVTYPSDKSFDEATSLTLYKVVDGLATGNVQVTPVAFIEIANEYDLADTYYQSYDYAASGQAIITYDAQNSIAQFPKVTVVTGSKVPNPANAPAGITISYFSNGVASQNEIYNSGSWIYNYNQLLNGVLLKKLQYDNKGNLVSSQTNYWQIYQNNIIQKSYLYGAFYRLSKGVAMKDGVSQTTTVSYYQDLGLQQSSETSYYDSSGELKTILNEKKYAIQVDAYNSVMAQKHLLNAVAQESTSVTGKDGKQNYISSTAVTWKNWSNDGSWKWAAFQNYQWLGPATGTPSFNFTDGAQRQGWLKKQEIVQRGLPFNTITEMLNVDGVPSSYIYDKTGQFQIAEFLTASRQGDEASYYSFESYEDPDKWQLGSAAVIIPNSNDATIDAKTGTSSLKITSGTGIQRQFTPQNQNDPYIFSSYIKLPEGFKPEMGAANWIISFTQGNTAVGTPITLPFGTTIGSWQYVYAILPFPQAVAGNGAITITIKAQNDNTASPVLVDCVRFSPLHSLFSGASIDESAGVVNAVLGSNGEVRQKFFDDFQRIIATTGFSGDVNSIATSYFSRTGNDNTFSVEDPNAKLKVLSAGGGPALSFTQGNEWSNYWTPESGSVWQAQAGELILSSFSTKGTLAYTAAMTNNYSILVNAMPMETLTQPLGLQVGTMFTVQWDTATGVWQLLDNKGTMLQQKSCTAFSIPNPSGNSPAQLAAALQPELLRRGKNISTDANNLVIKENSIYDKVYRRHFTLKAGVSSTDVSTVGNEWLLLVNSDTLFFFVDGQLVFNYVSQQPITGNATFFAGNSVALGSLITGFDNQLTFTCANETGNDIQSQLLDKTQLSITGNVYDNCGRIIANTKPAFVTSGQTPLFEYCDTFVSYDTATGIMSGLIADFYPDDMGYPYFGTRYEASPLSRTVEKSMPGKDYKLGTHTQLIAYGTNDGSYALPAAQYSQTTITDQNGNTVTSIKDKRGLEVRKISSKTSTQQIVSAVYYDDNGNPVEMHSPNYSDATADNLNWVTTNQYNFLGQLLSTKSSSGGQVLTIFDNANRLRFRMDAEAALQGNYQYYKYDPSGRVVETGYLTATWDSATLQQQANNNPELPATPNTWRLKTFYDDSGANIPFEVGQIVKTLSNQSDNGQPDVEENFTYDVYGNVKSRSQKVNSFDKNAYTTMFSYNNLGGIVKIDYPLQNTGSDLSVYYSYNSIGQIIGISNDSAKTDNLAAYKYNPAGKPTQEILNPYSATPVKRDFAYTPQVWLQEVQDTQGKNQLFSQQLKTDASASNGPVYYNGQSAEIEFNYPAGIEAGSTYTNWYNGLNSLEKVNETSDYITPVERQYSFDSNGNFNTVKIGDESFLYSPEKDKGDRLQSVNNNAGEIVFGFTYNENGAVTNYKAMASALGDSQNLTFSYDAGTRMTTLVKNAENSKSYNLYYSSANDRVLKQETSGGNITANTLYIKGLSGNTLVQIHNENNTAQVMCMMYGPVGMIGFVKDNKQYNTIKDYLGSVRVIVDAEASIIAAYDYDIYGNPTVLKEPENNFFPYLFTSQEFDAEIGIYNYKARFYFSRVGRFGVTDNYNQFYSPYTYAANSPMVYIDPSGNFSIGNFFSAIGGAIIGAIEILIGVVVDIVAGVLEALTLGLSTPVSVGLSMVAGAFIGSGISAVSYSAVGLITNDFSWKDYGINTAVGFVAGAITAGFGAVGAVAAEAATGVEAATKAGEAVSTLAKVANSGIKAGFTVAGAEVATTASTFINNSAAGESLTTGLGENLVSGILSSSLSWAIPDVDYKAGWGNLLKRMSASVAKSEAVGITMQMGTNAVNGDKLDNGLLNTMVGGVFEGSIGGLGSKDYAKDTVNSIGLYF